MESRFSTQFAPGPASKGALLDHHEQQGHPRLSSGADCLRRSFQLEVVALLDGCSLVLLVAAVNPHPIAIPDRKDLNMASSSSKSVPKQDSIKPMELTVSQEAALTEIAVVACVAETKTTTRDSCPLAPPTRAMQRSGLIEYHRGKVKIPNRENLEAA
jgi:hypothetical protein